MRCARCSHQWDQEPQTDVYDEPEAEEFDSADTDETDGEEGGDEQAASPIARRSRRAAAASTRNARGGWIGWAILIVVLAALGSGGVFFRLTIVEVWPPATPLYEMVGLSLDKPEQPLGLEIGKVAYEQNREAGQPVLRVTGEVTNVSEAVVVVPRLRVALEDENKRVLYHWTVSLSKSELDPGAVVPFSTRLPNPPKNARNLSVTFIVDQ